MYEEQFSKRLAELRTKKGSICERHESFHWAKSRIYSCNRMWNYLSYHVELLFIYVSTST
mgnify:CR=1 FL=1